MTAVLAAGLAGVLAILATRSVAYFSHPETSLWSFVSGTSWSQFGGGMWPFLVGTAVVAALSLLIAIPLSLLIAVYLSELATSTARRWIKPTLEVLAGVPPVVYGFFALTTLGPALATAIPGASGSALVASLAIAIMITPNLSSLFDDALQRIPSAIREGAYALGGGRASVVGRVLLPTARPAIVAAVLLSLSRAAGETIIVLFLSRASEGGLPLNPLAPAMTVTSHTIRTAEVTGAGLAYDSTFALLLILALLSMLIHRGSKRLRRHAGVPS